MVGDGMNTSNIQSRELPQHITGVNNPLRLRVVEESQLSGHMGDQDLDAIRKVSTKNVRGTHQFRIQNVNFRPPRDPLSSPPHLVG